jgi:hypothetical protein
MKIKMMPYVGFFIVSLALAYFAADEGAHESESGQNWLKLAKGSIQEIAYEEDGNQTHVKKGQGEGIYWIETVLKLKSPEGEKEEKDRFLANEKLEEALERFHSFEVEKVIGDAKGLKLEEFGLDKPVGRLVVKYGENQELKLAIGKRSFQSPEVFVLDEGKQTVLLLDRQTIALLERPKNRLALTQPYRFKPDDLAAAMLSQEDKTAEFVQQGKGQARAWFTRGKSDSPNEAFRNWLDKLLKLRVEAYPSEEQVAGIEQLPRKFSILFRDERKELDLLTFYEDSSASPLRYWVKSRSLPLPVAVEGSKVSVLLADLKGILP